MNKNTFSDKNRYIFYKDKRILAIALIFIAVILQVSEFTNTPGLATIHAYTIGVLFGKYSLFFYFYCFLISIRVIFKRIKILKIIKLTVFTYWFFALSVISMSITWIYYIHDRNVPLSNESFGMNGFRHSFGLWWDNFSNPKNAWIPSSGDAGIIGAFLFSTFSSFSSAVGAGIIFTILSILSCSLIISGTWIGLYRSIISGEGVILFNKSRVFRKNNNKDSIINKNDPFIKIDVIDAKTHLPFEDVSSLEKGVDKSKILNDNLYVNKWKEYSIDCEKNIIYPQEASIKPSLQREIDKKRNSLNNLFKTFNLDAKIIDYIIGPTITKFIIKGSTDIDLKRFEDITHNIRMALEVKKVRLELPIPGEALIGIEFENETKIIVPFWEIFKDIKSSTAFLKVALGKDIKGNSIIIGIDKAPHLLIAGAPASGESVMINTIISSLIIMHSPRNLRLLLIDSRLKLESYNGIAHLLTPIITNSAKAIKSLDILIKIIEERYETMSRFQVHNIKDYNIIANKNNLEYWAHIVVIINELSDLMKISSKSVENSIKIIAQKSKAIGIHIIIATQHPYSNILTRIIKEHIPSRISLTVIAAADSKVILNLPGADKLIGQGDMLMLLHSKHLKRIQGSFLSNLEIEKIITKVKRYGDSDYDSRFIQKEVKKDDEKLPNSFQGY